jgi:transposase
MVRIGPLSDEQRRALEGVRRRAVGRVSQRAHMVLLRARGYPVAQIAEVCGVGEDVARKWRHRYHAGGPPGLEDRPRPGRPPNDRLARHIVDAQASHPPCNRGLVQGGWTAGLLAPFLAARFRLILSSASVRPTCTGPAGAGRDPGWPRRRTRRARSGRRIRRRRSSLPGSPRRSRRRRRSCSSMHATASCGR